MSIEYVARIGSFAERHYVKSFEKKYKGAWGITLKGLLAEFKNFDVLFAKSNATTITDVDKIKICKVDFRVHGTGESRRGSGNRYIVALHKESAEANILLVYCKTDVRGDRETDWWKGMIRDNYPEYKRLF